MPFLSARPRVDHLDSINVRYQVCWRFAKRRPNFSDLPAARLATADTQLLGSEFKPKAKPESDCGVTAIHGKHLPGDVLAGIGGE